MTTLDIPAGLDEPIVRLWQDERWRRLTVQPEKLTYFSTDAYFRESWQIANQELGPRADWYLQRLAMVTLKPDAVLTRRAATCLEFMADNGFIPIDAHRFRYSRANTRELWRYQWNIATLDRWRLYDMLHVREDALKLVFIDARQPWTIPASARLALLKGSAFPQDRQPGQLRSVLGALNRILVLAHCTDEPMDIVRELGILFPPEGLAQLYRLLRRRVDAATPIDVFPTVDGLYADTPEENLDLEQHVTQVRAEIAAKRPTSPAAADRASAALTEARDNYGVAYLDWFRWSADLAALGIEVNTWPVLVVASHYVRHNIPGAQCFLGGSGARDWVAGNGEVLP